jgi:hypothetical protein
MKHTILALLCITLSLTLSACGGSNAREILGLGRKNPDEFRVVSRPPLSMPPDFTLRPPSDSDTLTGLPAADTAARAAVIGRSEQEVIGSARMMGDAESAVGIVKSYDLGSSADEGFLGRIGAETADDNIRNILNEEAAAEFATTEEKDDSTFGWLQPTKNESEVIVDAAAEKERLLENKSSGKKLNEGEVPVIEPKTRGVLEKIL